MYGSAIFGSLTVWVGFGILFSSCIQAHRRAAAFGL